MLSYSQQHSPCFKWKTRIERTNKLYIARDCDCIKKESSSSHTHMAAPPERWYKNCLSMWHSLTHITISFYFIFHYLFACAFFIHFCLRFFFFFFFLCAARCSFVHFFCSRYNTFLLQLFLLSFSLNRKISHKYFSLCFRLSTFSYFLCIFRPAPHAHTQQQKKKQQNK